MKLININLISMFIFATILLPLAVSYVLSYLGNATKQQLVNNFGNNSQIVIGGLGVIIHELGHLITCLIFFHKITGFKLLRLHDLKDHDTLGYVNHEWSNNLYEIMGNFFIGLAPCYFCSLILWSIHGLFFGNQKINFGNSVNNIIPAVETAWSNILHPFGNFSWQLIIYLILIVIISSTGYGLSKADLKNSWSGLEYWMLLILIFYILTVLFGATNIVSGILWALIVLWLTFLGRGLIYLLVTLALIIGLKKVI